MPSWRPPHRGVPGGPHRPARLKRARSRPTWRILLYSARTARDGLVLVDGVDGEIVAHFTEDNPEDWSDLGDVRR